MSETLEPFLTPPEIAKLMRVSPDTVLGWIRCAELRAVNVGSGTKRARYPISREGFNKFLRRREVQPPAPRRSSRSSSRQLDGGPIDLVRQCVQTKGTSCRAFQPTTCLAVFCC